MELYDYFRLNNNYNLNYLYILSKKVLEKVL